MNHSDLQMLSEAYTGMYEAEDIDEARVDDKLSPLEKIRKRNREYFKNTPETSQKTTQRRLERKSERGVRNSKGGKSAFGTMRHIGGPYKGDNYARYMGKPQKEQFDVYDLVLSHLLDEGYADDVNSAEAIMVNMSEEWLNEISYSAKKARAGEDIGKPGKEFSKIAKSAAKRYGSKESGERVAGAILAKLRNK